MQVLHALNSGLQWFFDNNPKAASSLVTMLVLMGTTWFARYKIPPNNWFLVALRVILGAVYDKVHPADFKELAANARKPKQLAAGEEKQES